ncbi:hypothetical protein CISIN_1g023584mg [Citrus sinensis]|uniref:DUF4218 domain-containing protein n=1 Tax=Citrus sinensis TaxID=2711 RepID=A0A067EJA1_CITSI|nr:hypothetical protein CISIN_1g023584mg [Citrus sinensis]
MKEYKGYIRNCRRPEGCIAECYLGEECVAFCSGYIQQRIKVNTKDLCNDYFSNGIILEGHPISRGTPIALSSDMLESAHHYVLFNTAVVEPYLEMHLKELKQSNKCLAKNPNLLWKRHVETFLTWLNQKAPPRGYYELEMYDEKEDTTCVLENMLDKNIEDYNDGVTYRRIDCEDILNIAMDGDKVEVIFNSKGQPIGEGSISLSSFLGSLVREHVPYTISDWRKLPLNLKEVLWECIKTLQKRYKLDGQWQRAYMFQEMAGLWRASKSRLVQKILKAKK